MPTFIYKATNPKKQIESGTVTAKNKQEAAEELQRRNLDPLSLKKESKSTKLTGSVPTMEKITFVRYLSTMLVSGISLSEGILVLQDETQHPLMKKIISDISYSLDQGQQLSAVFEKYPKVFDRLFITLTKAGEISGTLGESFTYLEEELRAEYSLSQNIKGALLYPAVVFIAMFAIAILMFFFILPQIGKVFLSMSLPLPTLTRLLFSFSITLAKYKLFIILGIVGGLIGLFLFLKSAKGKKLILALISPFPVVKTLLRQIDLARFTRIFSTLIKSAVPITEALEISLSSLSWATYRNMATELTEDITKGKNLSDALKKHKEFPGILTQMISTGEKSGTLDKTLGDLAKFYEQEIEESVKNATQLLEPMLMLIVGIGVGAIILSIISPLYSVVGNLQDMS